MGNRVDISEVKSFYDMQKRETDQIIEGIHAIRKNISQISKMKDFQGKTAEAAKLYFSQYHGVILDEFETLFQTLEQNLQQHLNAFSESVDASSSARLESNYLMDQELELEKRYDQLEGQADEINRIIRSISDISSVSAPSLTPVPDRANDAQGVVVKSRKRLDSFTSVGKRDISSAQSSIEKIESLLKKSGGRSKVRSSDWFEKQLMVLMKELMKGKNLSSSKIDLARFRELSRWLIDDKFSILPIQIMNGQKIGSVANVLSTGVLMKVFYRIMADVLNVTQRLMIPVLDRLNLITAQPILMFGGFNNLRKSVIKPKFETLMKTGDPFDINVHFQNRWTQIASTSPIIAQNEIAFRQIQNVLSTDALKKACHRSKIEVTEEKGYLHRTLNQIIFGHYKEDDVTILGTGTMIGLGLWGLDLPANVRDLFHDLQHWEWSWGHVGKTGFDAIGVIPVIGAVRYLRQVDKLMGGNVIGNGIRLIPGSSCVITGGNSNKLGKNMLEDMGLKRSTRWSGYQAQHIIPSEMANNPVIQKIGMNFDDSTNGIFLRVPANDISVMSRHSGYHSVYNEVVERALNRMDINQSVDNLQKQVYDLQNNLRILQESGLPLYPSQGATVELWERMLRKLEK
ncbi:T7SS effector LXG polymorphic toxin [Litchfieldia alkalitelluris]|uniref:T7SS effector LXG polymorphic toxin n=1 Tax=Litchfieldia alkalitelluris TaxID=304268 RepID=UPI000B4333F2|nr:T7SS effector LXG polymorphic toxin [Litchfieldia alkalitelluris]